MNNHPTVTFDASRTGWFAIKDLIDGFKQTQVWLTFAMMDVKLLYRRTYLGPFWITISMGAMVAALGYVFGTIFKADVATYIPYLAIGIIIWTYISSTISDGCTTFTNSTSYIKNLSLPLSVYLYRMLARNFIIMLHNMLIVLAIFLIFPPSFSPVYLLAIPGIILLTLNLSWIALFFGIIGSRYRDIPAAITSVLAIGYLVTPVFWNADIVNDRSHIVDYNPFYHLIKIVRAPLLGEMPTSINYLVCLGMLAIGTAITLFLYKLKSHRLSYWL